MGDLSFSLTLKSRIEEETKKITKELNKIDATGKQAQNALEAISEATKGIGDKGGRGFEKLNNFVKELRRNIAVFSSEDFFSPKKLQQLESVQDGLYKIGSILGEVSKKGAGFNIFPNSVATEANKAERELYKLSSFINEINKRHGEGIQIFGVDSTNNIRQSLSELSKYRTELEQIRNNGGIHPITGLTASDVVKSAGFLNAIDEAKVYAKVVKDAIKQESDEYTRKQKQSEQYLDQLNREGLALQRNADIRDRIASQQEKAWQKESRSGFRGGLYATPGRSEAAQGYLDIANAYKKAADELQTKHNDANSKLTKLLDEYNKEVKELESKIKAISPKMDGLVWNGKKLSPTDLAKYEELAKQLEHLKNTKGADIVFDQAKLTAEEAKIQRLISLVSEYEKLAERVSKATYKPYDSTSYEQRRISETAALKNAILERYKTAQDAEKKRKKDEADATREAKANEKQRQNELKNTERRYDSLGNKVRQLRSEYSRGISIGADVSKTEAEIHRLISIMRQLQNIKDSLSSPIGWKGYLGQLGNIGSGHDTTLASRVLQDQKAVNREVQRGIELEQKRQQEIAQTAAKVQSDLVRGFERANSHAGKLNSTVQDLKSLFLQGGLVFGAQQFAMSIITTGGEIEKQHIALQSILGDVQNANTMFNQTKELALNSPFTFSELNRDVKQLAAYGVEYDQLYDTTKRLADMSSGLGVSFDRIALAFGQVQARGWLDGKELRQIAYAGIPLLDKLSKYYSEQEGRKVSTSEIKTRISSREVSFDDVKNIFWQMTDAGGQFYNMQQTLSETLLGRYNKLKDAWEIMLSEFASGNSVVGGFFKTALDGATALVQTFHTLAPVVTAAFSGYALTKLSRMMGGNAGSAYLSTKGKLAVDASAKIAEGKQLNSVERNILATKNRITGVDLRNLIANKAINKTDLQRLLVTGKISTKQYQVYTALLRQQEATDALKTKTFTYGLSWTRVGVAAKLVLNGIATAASSMWAAIGGLPGLIVTGVTMLVAKLWGDYAELTNAIKQTNDELVDRQKQMNEFRSRNDAKSIISRGDSKEIDNAINDYEEKLKELSPYEADLFIMSANERKSHEDRLKYLEEQLKLMQEANNVVQSKLANRDNYSDLQDLFDSARRKVEQYSQAKDKLISFVPDKTESDENNFLDKKNLERWVNNSMQQLDSASRKISEKISEMYKGIKAPKAEIESMQKQTIDSFVSGLSIPEEQMKDLRLSIYKNLGLLNGALKVELGQKLAKSVADSMPEAANAIRSGRELDEASKNKVKEIAKGCIEQMKAEYPRFANELQGMLNASSFQAVIRLIYTSDSFPKFTEAEQSLYDQYIPAPQRTGSSKKDKKFSAFIKSLGGSGKNSTGKDLNDAAYQKLQKLWETAEAVKVGKYDKAYKDKTVKAYLDQKALTEEILGIKFVPTYNKSNKPYKPGKSGGSKEDKQLKNLRNRIDLYKKMYAEIKKYKELFGEGALGQLANDGEFKAIFGDKKRFPISDYTNYETSIKELLRTLPASTKDRLDYAANEKAGIQTENRKLLEDQRRDELNILNKQLDVISEQYETYRKIYELTGNKKGSENIAFGGTVQFGTYKRFLEEQLDVAVKHDNIQSGLNLTTDEVKGMSLENVKDRYGSESRVYDIRKKLEDENNKIKKETIDLMASLIEKNATIAQQIEDENRKYERQLELIKGIKDPQMRERAQAGATKTHNENVAKLQFEQFKQESDWVTIFDDLDRVSSSTINSMIEKIDGFSKTTGLSVEVVKQLRDALGKLRDEQIDRNPINGIVGGMQRGNAIGSFIGSRFRKGMDISTTTYVDSSDAKKMGIKEGNYTKGQLENEKKGAYDDANKGVSKLADKFKALQDCLTPVISLFEVLGEEDSFLGQATNMASGAFGAAAQVSGDLNALGLGSLGPYGAAAGAALSVVTSLFAMHDKARQKEIEASEERQKELDNMTKNVKSIIEDALGGIYSYKERSDTKSTISKITSNFELADAWKKTGIGKSFPFLVKSVYSKETYEAAKEAQSKPGSAYHAELASLKAQKDELQSQRNSENEKKKKDNSKIADYDQQIKEMELQIDSFAKDFLKDIYSIDFKSWASELTDAVVGAWEKGEDAVEAYKEKVKDMVKDVTKNIVTQKIMEAALQKPLDYLTNILKDKGKLDETDMNQLADLLYKAGDEAIPQITGIFEALKKRGLDLRDNGSSSSTKNSIQSITEETADILASYLNAVRLDVSVIREMQGKFIPEMSEIAKSQLTQLNLIAQNTLRNADAAERIEKIFIEYNDNFNRVINGTKSLKMK